MKIRFLFGLSALAFLLSMSAAEAHDSLQANTNVSLRPDQMEIEVIMSRVPSRSLVDNAPDVPVTMDNFESTYHALLQQSAAAMTEVTLDGKKIAPSSISVALYEETDLRFDFLYPRPTNGRLRVATPFVKKMDDGYMNTLIVYDRGTVLGRGVLTADHTVWEYALGSTAAQSPNQPYISHDQHDSYFIIPHFNYLTYIIAAVVILALVFLAVRNRDDNVPPKA